MMIQEIEHTVAQLLALFNQYLDELDARIEAQVQQVLDELEQIYDE